MSASGLQQVQLVLLFVHLEIESDHFVRLGDSSHRRAADPLGDCGVVRRRKPSGLRQFDEVKSVNGVAMIEKAVDEGYNVIVMPGYAFGGAIVEAAPEFPDVKFIALDVAKGDLLEAGRSASTPTV